MLKLFLRVKKYSKPLLAAVAFSAEEIENSGCKKRSVLSRALAKFHETSAIDTLELLLLRLVRQIVFNEFENKAEKAL